MARGSELEIPRGRLRFLFFGRVRRIELAVFVVPIGTATQQGSLSFAEGFQTFFASWPGILFFPLAFLLLATLPYGAWRRRNALEDEASELLEELRFLDEALKKVEKDLFPREGDDLEGDPTLLLRREAFLRRIEDLRQRSIPEAFEEFERARKVKAFRKILALESAILYVRQVLEEGGRYLVLPPSLAYSPKSGGAFSSEVPEFRSTASSGTNSPNQSSLEQIVSDEEDVVFRDRAFSKGVREDIPEEPSQEVENPSVSTFSLPSLGVQGFSQGFTRSLGGEIRIPEEFHALLEEDERTATLLAEVRAKLGLRLVRLEERLSALRQEVGGLVRRYEEGRPPLSETLLRLRNAYGEMRDEVRQLVAWGEKIEGEMPEIFKRLETELQSLMDVAPLAKGEEAEEHLRAMKLLWHRLPPLWDQGDLASLRDVGEAFERRKELLEDLLTAERHLRVKVDAQLAALHDGLDELQKLLSFAVTLAEKLGEQYILPAEARTELATRTAEYEAFLHARQKAEDQVRAREFREAEVSLDHLLETCTEARRGMRGFIEWLEDISREEAELRRRLDEVSSRLRRLIQEVERIFYTDRTPYHERIAVLEQERPTWEGRLSLRPLDLEGVKEGFRNYLERIETVEEETHADLHALREAERAVLLLNSYRYEVPEVGRWLMEAENAFWDGRFREAQAFARRALDTGTKLGVFQEITR